MTVLLVERSEVCGRKSTKTAKASSPTKAGSPTKSPRSSEASTSVVLVAGASGTVLCGSSAEASEASSSVVLVTGTSHTVLSLGPGEGATEAEEQESEAGELHAGAAGVTLCYWVEDPPFIPGRVGPLRCRADRQMQGSTPVWPGGWRRGD